MGGGVAWNYTLAHPEKVDALILVDSAGAPVDPAAMKDRKGQPLIFKIMRTAPGRAILKRLNPRPLTGKGLKQAYIDESLVTPALVDRVLELYFAKTVAVGTPRGSSATGAAPQDGPSSLEFEAAQLSADQASETASSTSILAAR